MNNIYGIFGQALTTAKASLQDGWGMGHIDLKKEAFLAPYFGISPRDGFSWNRAP